jgi:phenylacetate-coenzyme A ligase PaaK-like adenylate-forming protein
MIDAERFSDDPAACFEGKVNLLHTLGRDELERLQLHAISARFTTLLPKLLPLALLAEAAGTTALKSLDDAASLLFPHSFYKSYDDYLIDHGCYNDLTDWMQKLTAVDLSNVRERDFATFDQWFDTLEQEAGLVVTHSSGTTGRLSLCPRSTAEVENTARYAKLTIPDWSGDAKDSTQGAQFSVIWTTFAQGRSAVARGSYAFQHGYAKSPHDFHAVIPGKLSADWHHFMMRVHVAETAGQSLPFASQYVAERLDEMDANFKAHDAQTDAILDLMSDRLKDERILLAGAPFVLLQLAQAGARRGLTNLLAPGSVIMTFGGLKGKPAEDRMAETILRFGGLDALTNLFVMTEAGSALNACDHGQFHFYPWVVPYLLDPATGALLPRDGTRAGRLALFDLLAKTYWGGLVTADQVTLDWAPCACGRASARIHPDISRFDDGAGVSVPPCPAGEVVIHEAMRALNA